VARLVTISDGEPWFDNPRLILANRPRRKKGRKTNMRTNRRRRRRGLKNSPRRRRARRNFYTAGVLANRPRRRSRRRRSYRTNEYFTNRRRRSRRSSAGGFGRGSQLFGIAIPPIDAVVSTAAGLIVPTIVSGWLLQAIPTSWKTNTDGTPNQITAFAVKAAAVVLPSMVVRQFVSRRAGNIMLVAGAAWFVMEAVRTFAPGIIPGLGYQPMLGAYIPNRAPRNLGNGNRGPGKLVNGPGMPYITASAPGRMDPAQRF
jgi:hypothetical protein